VSDGLRLRVLPEPLAVCRLSADAGLPGWAAAGVLRSITWTPDELSIVCDDSAVPEGVRAERGWRALLVEGPLDLGQTGILLQLAEPLAIVDVSIFTISTFDTDYVLVKEPLLGLALRALTDAGHTVR
jgi:hypothetical protein